MTRSKIYHSTYTLFKGGEYASEEPDEGRHQVRFCEGVHSNLGATRYNGKNGTREKYLTSELLAILEVVHISIPIAICLFAMIYPFTMAFFAWLSLSVAPCTAMVLVWSYLAEGNMGHTLVMTAINSLTMVFLFAPLATFLIGVSDIEVPLKTIALAVIIYVCTPPDRRVDYRGQNN
ncbi:MAG: hypothetical protein N2V72_08000 [Methanophagales archaeon]|nr:hypothetical protein [Methanophagales archaeon]